MSSDEIPFSVNLDPDSDGFVPLWSPFTERRFKIQDVPEDDVDLSTVHCPYTGQVTEAPFSPEVMACIEYEISLQMQKTLDGSLSQGLSGSLKFTADRLPSPPEPEVFGLDWPIHKFQDGFEIKHDSKSETLFHPVTGVSEQVSL